MEWYMQAVGEMETNAYIAFAPERDDALVIDPGAEPMAIQLALRGRRLAGILLTHGHFDHIGAVAALRGPDTPVYIHEKDAPMLTNPNLSLAVMLGGPGSQGEPDFCLQAGPIELAGLSFEVLHTPGHTPGSVSFLFGGCLFSGDTLFCQGVGRTDFPGGDAEALRDSVQKLLALDPAVAVLPGHGPATTIGGERRFH